MLRKIYAVLLMLGAVAPANAQQSAFQPVADSIEALIKRGAFPSAAVAVAKGSRIVYEAGFGLADRERGVRADANTMYSLASISKPFTATALMTLVDQGRVNLDAPINRYLSNAKLTGLAGDAEKATVRLVASHMAGLPLHYEFFYEGEDHKERPMNVAIARYGVLVNPPGAVYEYSNLGYGILDEVVSQVSRSSYRDYMRQNVFAPLGLTRTSVHLTKELAPFAAQRYLPDNTPIPYYDFDHDGGSAVYSSAHDLVRFGMYHLGAKLPEQRAILKSETRSLMQQPISPASGNSLGYGIGWSMVNAFGKRQVSHTGGMPGVSTVLQLYPEDSVVVVVLTNQSNAFVGRIAAELAAAAMPDFAARRAEAQRQPQTPPATPSFHADAQLLGTWEGTLRTYDRELPLRLTVQESGITVTLADQPALELAGAVFRPQTGQLTGRFNTTIPTEDARRHPHSVLLNVYLRNGVLQGQASAQTTAPPIYFALSSYVQLTRK